MIPEPDSLHQVLDYAARVVRLQGALFLRNLLREKQRIHKDIKIGATKEEIYGNLVQAIEAGFITILDLESFVKKVEGWGSQHIYLYNSSKVTITESLDETIIKNLLPDQNPDRLDNKQPDTEFPDELILRELTVASESIELIWRQRTERWNRSKRQDKSPEELGGYVYEFRAYRLDLKRSVMRFFLDRKRNLAALTIQLPLQHHGHAREIARETLEKLIPFDKLDPIDISASIKHIDELELSKSAAHKESAIRSQSTRFESEGAAIQFETTSTLGPSTTAWKAVDEVRRVRKSLDPNQFKGESAKFSVPLKSGPGKNRVVIVALHGPHKRVYVQAQLTADEAWSIFDQVADASSA